MGFKICEILGVEVNEQFVIEGGDIIYYINSLGYMVNQDNIATNTIILTNLINGKYKLVKIPKPNADEQECLDFYSKHGYHWFAKDLSGLCYGYKNKPRKHDGGNFWISDGEHSLSIPMNLTFLSWKDDEPYHYEGEVS